ncbi:MAG: NAD(P)H-dependent oxidoreductase [Thermoplasmata archaeon]|nr:NAD(P)H-dependent oxidoreductase [Thermoplasmata archaeon]
MLKIGIIVGTTRPGRHADAVAKWVHARAAPRTTAEFQIVDIADFHLPLLDEPMPPSMGQYAKDHTKAWAARIATFDGFIFITPEYNHGIPGSLKNAIDFLYKEWNNKAAAIVSYGSVGGVRSAEQLRQVLGELQIADVRASVSLSLFDDFEHYQAFKPRPALEAALEPLFDQLLAWAGALKPLRSA